MSYGLLPFFGYEIFDAVVSVGGNSPIPLEIKICEFIHGDNVAAVNMGDLFENPIFNDPPLFGECLLFEAAPAGGGLPIEEKAPPFGLFGGGQLIVFGNSLVGGRK